MFDSSSSSAAVTGTLDASHDAHNRGVVDVEALEALTMNVPSSDNLADLVGSV
jgi:hypothetical protein